MTKHPDESNYPSLWPLLVDQVEALIYFPRTLPTTMVTDKAVSKLLIKCVLL